jgi:selenium donor protein
MSDELRATWGKPVRLTRLVSTAGYAAKLAPEALAQVLRPLQQVFAPTHYPEVLVGLGSPEDAAVYPLDADRALIVTTDFFTPIVDDRYDFGAITAANALSDVYAMGGEPLLAVSLVAFPPGLPEVLAEVLQGGAEKVQEARMAYLWVECLGGSGRALARELGLRPRSVNRAARRGHERSEFWRKILKI